MRKIFSTLLCGALCLSSLFTGITPLHTQAQSIVGNVSMYTTTSANNSFVSSNIVPVPASQAGSSNVITVNPNNKYQTVTGFGASMTESSAYNINQVLNSTRRNDVMTKLFDPVNGIGISVLRQPMGASDFATSAYTYDDLPNGVTTDTSLNYFSINPDRTNQIPLIKQALGLNPNISIFAVPWSPPAWMKTNGSLNSGSLSTNRYQVYANYFVKYIQAYQAENIPIFSISPQNEPLNGASHYPTCYMSASDQKTFIGSYLGPTLSANGLSNVKIIGYDHNWDQPAYPRELLNDNNAARYLDGIAWHIYSGDDTAMTDIYNEFPSKNVYFTESSCGNWVGGGNWSGNFLEQTRNGIRILRNYSKTFILWNIALDSNNGPVVPGFGTSDCYGLIKVNGSNSVSYQGGYYALGHFSKWILPGAQRIDSNTISNVENVVFKNSDGSYALVARNGSSNRSRTITVKFDNSAFTATLPAASVATFTWTPETEVETVFARHEFESGQINKGVISSGISGASGGQFVGELNSSSATGISNLEESSFVKFVFNTTAGGYYPFKMQYTGSDSGVRPNVYVNGRLTQLLLPPGNSWDTLCQYEFDLLLDSGINTIFFVRNGDWCNYDYLETDENLTRVLPDTANGRYQAEDAALAHATVKPFSSHLDTSGFYVNGLSSNSSITFTVKNTASQNVTTDLHIRYRLPASSQIGIKQNNQTEQFITLPAASEWSIFTLKNQVLTPQNNTFIIRIITASGFEIDYFQTGVYEINVSSPLSIDSATGYIYGLPPQTPAANLAGLINSANGTLQLPTGGAVGTDAKAKLFMGDHLMQTLTFVVSGDVNGDGFIRINDLILMKKALSHTYTLPPAALAAADITKSGQFDAVDLVAVRKYLLGLL